MMEHANGWMNDWPGGASMWIWPVVGVLLVVLVVAVIMKVARK